jgi:uncharacterized protein
MLHPQVELRFIDDQMGYGVFATQFIPAGTIVWVRDALDQAFSAERLAALDEHYQAIVTKYCYVDVRGDFVLCWDHGRYVNHRCEPTCRSAGYDFEIAVRDIHVGEELTDDYGSLNIEYDFRCHCGASSCRGELIPGDLLRYSERWDAEIAEPFMKIGEVPQPLWYLVTESEKAQVAEVLAGQAPIASCLAHYCALVGSV